MKPSPDDIQELYLDSFRALGIDPADHDIRFVEDNWENPDVGRRRTGMGSVVDGMEITQFTYFQQVGGLEADPVSVEITYGLERLASYMQDKENVYDLEWVEGVTYGDVSARRRLNIPGTPLRSADTDHLFPLFDAYEQEAVRALDATLVLPAYDWVLKCSHTFNLLEARGAISVTQRTGYIGRVRDLARSCAKTYVEERERLGFPLLKGGGKRG